MFPFVSEWMHRLSVAVVFLVAQLQDCVEAVCNKCAQASGPRKIYNKQEGRQSAQGKEEDGANYG